MISHDNGNAIGRSHKESIAQNHISISIAITGGSEVWTNPSLSTDSHLIYKVLRIGQIGIWMAAAKVLEDITPHEIVDSEALLEDFLGVWARDTMHTVKAHCKILSVDKGADLVEIEEVLHEVDIIIRTIDNIDCDYFAVDELLFALADFAQVDGFIINKSLIGFHLLCFGEHRLRHSFRSWTTVRAIKLDTEIFVWSARVVTGREDHATHAILIHSPDKVGNRRSREKSILTNKYLSDAVGKGDLNDLMNRSFVIISSVTSNNK